MARLQCQLEALQGGEMPEPEEMEATTASLPLLIGADGVMVPFRPHGGQPNGRTVWREVKVGIVGSILDETGWDRRIPGGVGGSLLGHRPIQEEREEVVPRACRALTFWLRGSSTLEGYR